ncbi:MAG TPA: FAD-dependent oxidoreductase [Xanthobacteraceae bacterium]|nr:FAD-dependent oxidoreductase [Xanthobacteraceae bacterium]
MAEARKILVIGCGPAGVWAAISAKKQNPFADVTLLSNEHCEPYEKPPLSKGVLTGKSRAEDAPIAGPKGLTGHGVTFMPHSHVVSIERAVKMVALEDGRQLPYDALVIATGSVVRQLPMFPAAMPNVFYLRTEKDSAALRAALGNAKTLVIIGAGLIGLEVAASARELGKDVIVLEVAPRILARVTDTEIGARVHEAHVKQGVDIRLNTTITAARNDSDGRVAIDTNHGTIHADAVLVGAGAVPDVTLAKAASLDVEIGIVVDEYGQTSDPAIFAAGDVTRFPGPDGHARLEDWRHAQDHGAVAGRNAAGANDSYNPVPSFWSEQYDLYIQGIGWPPAQQNGYIHRPMPGNASLAFRVSGNYISYALGINVQRDVATARRLIERKIAVDPANLTDPAKPLADLLKVARS